MLTYEISLPRLDSAAESGLKPFLSRAAGVILVWHRRARQRRHLSELDARLLDDIGVGRAAALAEAAKPFWRK